MTLRAPFPYFGGKSKAAPLIWERFGPVPNYVEAFAGSLAVLLGRPHEPGLETVNDKSAFIANFWRAVMADPEAVAHHADWPINETDLYAIHIWLVEQEATLRVRLEADPDWFDAKVAGRWVWGICSWLGSGWCALGGQYRKRPSLGNGGRGVHRTKPHLGDHGKGVNNPTSNVVAMLLELAERLRRVRVVCGEWHRVLAPAATYKCGGVKNKLTGILLDPPYDEDTGRKKGIYDTDSGTIAREVLAWCKRNGDNPFMRIALCGYAGEHDELEALGWDVVAWTAAGGYGVVGKGDSNRSRERIWFSPHCLKPQQPSLFDMVEA